MTRDEITKRVAEVVAKQLEIDVDQVTPNKSFVHDFKADSLRVVELVLALEEEFAMEIPDQAAEGIKTVGDAISYIEQHQG